MRDTVPIAIFASGGGTNLQALLDCENESSYDIALLITNKNDVGALERARRWGKKSVVLLNEGKTDREAEKEMQAVLEDNGIAFIALAGYLKKIPSGVISRYSSRIVNIHPALLPDFGGKGMYGKHVHEAVIEAGERITGPTVHYVDENYDTGEIIAQVPIAVLDGDDADTLAKKVLEVEHRLYPAVVDRLCRDILDENCGTLG
ncbi:MAG: phosphoribosylglycinamide formyltransferase [Gemmatimonadetes bacterium]|nr:phosphoribosylglycinamide formyltransferase [Gemmatimonadota bacterium]